MSTSNCVYYFLLFSISILERVIIDAQKLRGGVRFVDNIPRNALGKIVRPTLVSWLKEESSTK